jgi:LacI family transcriptional regulator
MMIRNKVPTIRDIAQRCGVTAATVSRVLNENYSNNFSVVKELRDNIFRVANELDYRPNFVAKSLVRRRTSTVGIIGKNTICTWPGDTYQKTLEAAVRFFQVNGYDVFSFAPNLERGASELPPWKVDGIVVIQECSQETIEEMEKIHLPYVVINGAGGPSASQVIPDDIEATRRAIGHLYYLGHRRIAYAGSTPEHRKHTSIQDRHETYLHELKEHGLECIAGHDSVFQSAPDFLAQAVKKEGATAILAYDHIVALKILHDVPLYDIQIPEQVSLMCFNDEYFCDIIKPPLTTMGIPSRKMSQLAAELLLKQLETSKNKRVTECIKLREELIIRASTDKPLNR